MKMYKVGGYYVAQDERGRVAPGDASALAIQAQWGEPETFLRMAYSYAWAPRWPAHLPHPANAALLWERPDPHFTCWDCDDTLVAANGHGNYAPVKVEHQSEPWLTPEAFMLRNAAGAIFWTDQCPDADAEEARYADMIAERGRILWEVPDHG